MEYDDAHDSTGLDFHAFCALFRERELGEHTTAQLRQRFRMLDVTGSGYVQKHECLRLSLLDALARSVTKITEIFEQWDQDGSGMVDQREFRRAVQSLGFGDVSTKQIEDVFLEIDTDGSGSISRHEMKKRLRKFAGVDVEQLHDLRRAAGGRVGAALGTSVKIHATGERSIPEVQ